jgi:serine/threonine-protein kinase
LRDFYVFLAAAPLLALVGGATTAAAENFGAIAYSQRDGASAHAYDYSSQDEAEERALQECGAGCTIVLWFKDACGALAAGEGHGYGVGWASSRPEAEALAMDNCRERSSDCAAVRWVCTTR